jgi:hypothetical protein
MHETMRNTKDVKTDAQKRQWWENRERLDQRLADLLPRIEDEWLGCWKVCRPAVMARSGVTVTRLLCFRYHTKECTEVPHAKNLGDITVLAFSTKCTKRSPRFSRVRYSGSGHGSSQSG